MKIHCPLVSVGFYLVCLFLRQGLCHLGWFQAHNLPSLVSGMLGLQAYTIVLGLWFYLFSFEYFLC